MCDVSTQHTHTHVFRATLIRLHCALMPTIVHFVHCKKGDFDVVNIENVYRLRLCKVAQASICSMCAYILQIQWANEQGNHKNPRNYIKTQDALNLKQHFPRFVASWHRSEWGRGSIGNEQISSVSLFDNCSSRSCKYSSNCARFPWNIVLDIAQKAKMTVTSRK